MINSILGVKGLLNRQNNRKPNLQCNNINNNIICIHLHSVCICGALNQSSCWAYSRFQKIKQPSDFIGMFLKGAFSFIAASLCAPETTCSIISMRGNRSVKVITSKLFARSSELQKKKGRVICREAAANFAPNAFNEPQILCHLIIFALPELHTFTQGVI